MLRGSQHLRLGRGRMAVRRAGGIGAVQWMLKRNCSVTPRSCSRLYAPLCVVSLGVGRLLLAAGRAPGDAVRLARAAGGGGGAAGYARHAADGERIALQRGRLVVETGDGGPLSSAIEFAPDWVRVETGDGDAR